MKPSLCRALLLFILGICLAAAVVTFTTTASDPEASDAPVAGAGRGEGALDLTKPVPREKVLALFKQLFALPAEDYLNWEESVEAGKIPADVRALHERIIAFNADAEIDPEELATDGLPFVDLPDGPRVYPILKATVGPTIGANISQEDLNSLLPELADIQRRISALEAEHAPDPSDEEEFAEARLEPGDLGIALVQESATETTTAFPISEGDDPNVFHVELPALLDGRHVMGARMGTAPYVSVHIRLTEEGSEVLARVTEENAGKMFAILIGGEYHAAVAIGGQIKTRNLQLPGGFTEEKAQTLLDSWTVAETEPPPE